MRQDSLAEPMRFLLKPAHFARHAELGIRPLQVITHATKRLSPRDATKLVKVLLQDPKFHAASALKVGDVKELLRMLWSMNTADAHTLLLDAATWPCSRHPDVAAAGLHRTLSLLDESVTPKLLVDQARVFAALEHALTNRRLPASCKAAVLAVKPEAEKVVTTQEGSDEERWSKHPTVNSASRPAGLGAVLRQAGLEPRQLGKGLTDLVRQIAEFGTVRVCKPEWVERLGRATLVLINSNSNPLPSSSPRNDNDDDLEDDGDFDEVMGNASAPAASAAAVAAVDTSGTTSTSATTKEAQRGREKERARVARRNERANLRALALANLVRFAALQPSPTELDTVVEETLLKVTGR
jgi:hypothetical protein